MFRFQTGIAEKAPQSLSIAFFLEGMKASGVDTSTQTLAQSLRAAGHRVTIFAPWQEQSDPSHSDTSMALLPSLRVSTRQPVYWTYPVSLKLFNRFRREHFDLLHVHTSTTVNLLAWQISNTFRAPIVHTYHTMSTEYAHYLGRAARKSGSLVQAMIQRLDRIVCDRAAAVIAPSRKARDYLVQLGVAAPIHLIPNGIDLSRFRQETSDFLQRRFGLNAQSTILLFVGRLNHEKRPLLAYSVCREIMRGNANIHLVFVGDGALRCELEKLIARDGLALQVHFTGVLPYAVMPHVYNSAHIWIAASQSEVHPLTAIEASACGLPAVAWRDQALEDIVISNQTGHLVESEDEFKVALRMLLNDLPLRLAMGMQAARQAETFSVENTARRLVELYRELAASRINKDSSMITCLPNKPTRGKTPTPLIHA